MDEGYLPTKARRIGVLLGCTAILLAACTARGDHTQPIPTVLFPAPDAAQRLVVVLPGRVDDLASLRRSGVVGTIHRHWPDADVVLAELTMSYYLDGDAPRKLHEQVIAPARGRGYAEVWVAGASLGGMGGIMYDRAYPGELDGIVLLAPYLGEPPILREIARDGGITQWDPGPRQDISAGNWQREMWRHLQSWSVDPERTRNIWLAYGRRDRLRSSMPALASLLPDGNVLVRPGGHSWQVWSPALGEALEAASARGRTKVRGQP
ncbi:MAG: alpha/beta hydrolase-fold protein [Pseudomonadota bacterium]|nr:alpha/beta hydrolase-fold protein [Pseudomonadota bacterium]